MSDLINYDLGDLVAPRPPVTVLCGSTRFYDQFRVHNLRLTLAGHIVLSIGCDTKSDAALVHEFIAEAGDPDVVKAQLDELHKRKIDLADRVFVLNVGGYIGDSTRSEIEYAQKIGRPIEYLVPVDSRPAPPPWEDREEYRADLVDPAGPDVA